MCRLRRPLIAAISCRTFLSGILSLPENVAMSDPPAFHGKNQAPGHVAHVDEVHNEVEIQAKTPAKKMPQHRRRRSKVVVTGSNWHCRASNYHRKAGRRSPYRDLLGENLGAGVWTR